MNIASKLVAVGALAIAASVGGNTLAAETTPATLVDAIKSGAVTFQFRYRYEDVDQDNSLENAHASTLKSRLNFTSAAYQGWQAQVEVDDVSAIGDDDYNSTSNHETNTSVVADPEGTEINQAWISYGGVFDTVAKFGRQRIVLDNERFVGGVGWRQNEQTFDGGSLVNKSLPNTILTYAYIDNVNRVFGPDDGTSTLWLGDWNSSIHLINLGYTGLPFGTVTVYDYLMDISDADVQSNTTYGLRFNGKQALSDTTSLLYTAEYAMQEDYADNPVSYDSGYYLAEAGLLLPASVKLMLGQEVLEGDADSAGKAFRTPLATLHKFQGYADVFLATPAAGIQDRYLSASVVLGGVTASADWHDFEAEDGDASYGDELDLTLMRKFGKYVTGLLKYADYREDGFAVDTRKIWVQLQLDF